MDVLVRASSIFTRRDAATGEIIWVLDGNQAFGSIVGGYCFDSQGNIIFGGGPLDSRAWLAKCDPYGQEIWKILLQDYTAEQRIISISTDSEDNIILARASTSGGERLMKYDPGGVLIWDDRNYAVNVTTDLHNNDFYSVARTIGWGRRRYNSDNELLWSASYLIDTSVALWFNEISLGGSENDNINSFRTQSGTHESWVIILSMEYNPGAEIVWNFPGRLHGSFFDDASEDAYAYGYMDGFGMRRLSRSGPDVWTYFPENSSGVAAANIHEGIIYLAYRAEHLGHNRWDSVKAIDANTLEVIWDKIGPNVGWINSFKFTPSVAPVIYNLQGEFTGSSIELSWQTQMSIDEFFVERERWALEGFPDV